MAKTPPLSCPMGGEMTHGESTHRESTHGEGRWSSWGLGGAPEADRPRLPLSSSLSSVGVMLPESERRAERIQVRVQSLYLETGEPPSHR